MRARPRWPSGWLVPAVCLLMLGIWLFSPDPSLPAAPMIGKAHVVDGDTLRLGDERIRLDGLDAPELEQSCTDRKGELWPCGRAARARLVELVAAQEVSCAPSKRDRYGRIVATCRVADGDPAQRLVGEGLAVADGRYASAALAARAAGLGIWAGPFERPADWRAANHGEDAGAAPPTRATTLLNWVRNVFFR